MKRSIFLIITIILLLMSIATFGYLLYQNTTLNKDVDNLKTNIVKVKDKINDEKSQINEKEDEYEKLKETVKEQFEELSIWEETKENLEKSLS